MPSLLSLPLLRIAFWLVDIIYIIGHCVNRRINHGGRPPVGSVARPC
jgi:hypothetical protein